MSADFESWSKESLALFARDATERMAQQKAEIEALRAEIEALRADLKAALAAYRELVCKSDQSR